MRLPPRRSSVFSTRLLAFLPSTPLLSGFRIAEQAQLSIIPTKRRCLDSHSSRESSSYRLAPKTALSATSLQSHLLAMLPSRRKPSALEVRHAQPLPEGSLARLDDSLSSPCPRATSEARNGPCALSRTAHPSVHSRELLLGSSAPSSTTLTFVSRCKHLDPSSSCRVGEQGLSCPHTHSNGAESIEMSCPSSRPPRSPQKMRTETSEQHSNVAE